MKNRVIFLSFIISQFFCGSIGTKAQSSLTYVPRATHSNQSTDLMQAFKDDLKAESQKVKSRQYSYILKKNINNLIQLVKKGAFIKDDSLHNYIGMVLSKLLENSQIKKPPRHFLISKDPEVNAYFTVAGTLIVNIGLISRIRSESDLAFVLAHEIAHSQLNHIDQTIIKYYTGLGNTKKERKDFKKGKITGEGIDLLQEVAYENGRFSKQMEMEADSLGFIYFKNARYCESDALSTLSLLDSATFPKYPLGYRLLEPFHSPDFPLQAHWLKNRPAGFNKKPSMALIYRVDSLITHPEIEERKEKLSTFIKTNHPVTAKNNVEYLNRVIRMAEFESVESAFYLRKYDQCIYKALQLKRQYPKNDYLVTTIAKVLLSLYHARSWGQFSFYVQPYTGYYHKELRQLNNFLYNLSTNEIAEVAFYFLDNKKNFNKNNQSHYYLLWEIAGVTGRKEVQKKIKSTYRTLFPDGKYHAQIK